MWANLQNIFGPILTAIGVFIVAGGGLGFIVFHIFKLLGEKWLNSKFDERLAAYKHAQQKELEQLRFKINALMDRTVKLHQREFDVLPETWKRLIKAYGMASGLVSALQEYPNITQMNDEQLEEFLEKSSLMKWQKAELKTSLDKTSYYIKAIFWHRLAQAKQAHTKFKLYLLKNGIFIPEPLKLKFTELDTIIFKALIEREINEQYPDPHQPPMREGATDLGNKGGQLLKSLELDVQGRLWNSQSAEL